MNRILQIFATIVIVAVLFGCGEEKKQESPLMNKEITEFNLRDIAQEMKEDPLIDAEDMRVFAAAANRFSVKKDTVIGATVGQLIEWQKEFVRNRASNQVVANTNYALMRMNTKNQYVGVIPGQTQEGKQFQQVWFIFDNNLPYDINKMKGEVRFVWINPQNADQKVQLKPLKFTYTRKPIKAESRDTIKLNHPFSQDDQMSKILATQARNLRGILDVKQVVFAEQEDPSEETAEK